MRPLIVFAPAPTRMVQSAPPADVTLLLEGTYPYVLGGVSAWVDQIIRGLPDLRFALFFIGAQKTSDQQPVYKLPPNAVSLTEVYLHEPLPESELQPAKTPEPFRGPIYDAMRGFYLATRSEDRAGAFWKLLEALDAAGGQFTFGNLLRNPESWDVLREAYLQFAPEESFIDFFWTVRFLHLPIWNLWRNRHRVPPAAVYHSVSAGYAGLIGAIAARNTGTPLLITEHGIYTKERIAEISYARWIYEPERTRIDYGQGLGKLKQLWINLFAFAGKLAYDQAERIITLYEGNALIQVAFGADRRKIEVIPNGIEPSNFDRICQAQLERWAASPSDKRVGFIGRVVPIKDVKTLLRAARLVVEKMPEVQFLIAGPHTEDPEYFDECLKIVRLLEIESHVCFLGPQKLMDILPRMDVMVLTSISEGLPLVVLEGMAAGIPQVATDVGACRELIFGRTPEDRALGRAGRITKIMSPEETANALIQILRCPETVRAMGMAGRRRTEEIYSMRKLVACYRRLYSSFQPALLDAKPTPAPPET